MVKLYTRHFSVVTWVARGLVTLLLVFCGDAKADNPAFSIRLVDGSLGLGELLSSADENQLAFHVQGFAQPFNFAPSQLHSVRRLDWKAEPGRQQLQGRLLFTIRNHQQLVGKIASVDESNFVIVSEHLGRLALPRNDLCQISMLHGAGQKIKSFFDAKDWKDPNNLDAWEIEGFRLKTNQSGSRLMTTYEMPQQQVEVRIALAWIGKPRFSIGLGVSADKKLNELNAQWGIAEGQKPIPTTGRLRGFASLEVWEDSLVLVRESAKQGDFALVRQLESDGNCELTVFLDLPSGIAVVQTVDGKLHQLQLDPKPDGEKEMGNSLKAVLLQNFGSGLTVERLDISTWDGVLPVEYSASQAVLVKADDSIVDGFIEGWDEATSSWLVRTPSEQLSLPLDQLKLVNFARPEKQINSLQTETPDIETPSDTETKSELQADTEAIASAAKTTDQSDVELVYLWLRDGSRVKGHLLAGGESGLSFLPSCGHESQLVAFSEISEITTSSLSQVAPIATANKIAAIGLSQIRGGFLEDTPESSMTALHWMPTCGLNASELDYNFSGEIRLENAPQATKVKSQEFTASDTIQPRAAVAAPEEFNIFRQIFGGAARPNQPKLSDKKIEKKPTKKVSKDSQIRFRSGDVAPATIVQVSEAGVRFESSRTATTFAPNKSIDQIYFQRAKGNKLTEDERKRLLTIPRAQKNDPPTHLVISAAGDYLRGHLIEVNPQTATVEVRGELMEFLTAELSEIVWLYDRNWSVAATKEPAEIVQPDTMEDSEFAVHVIVGGDQGLTLLPQKVQAGVLVGMSPLLGESSVKMTELTQLFFGPDAGKKARQRRSETYELSLAKSPKENTESTNGDTNPGANHPLVDNAAPDFSLKQLSGELFHLADQRGQIIVLDFWASWCGPCMQAMPQVDELLEEYRDAKVQLIAVNIQETKPRIELALQKLGVNCAIVLDVDGEVAAAYKANSIPQTVIIDKAGMVAKVIVGGGPNALGQIRQTIDSLLQRESDPTRAN